MNNEKYEQMASRIKELMADGKTMEQALAEINTKAPGFGTRQVADRVEWIKTIDSISELQKAIKTAFAKKSKAKGEDALKRYEAEIKAGQAHMNELMAQVNTAADPIAKGIELGASEGWVLQRIIDDQEAKVTTEMDARATKAGISKKTLKGLVNLAPEATPDSLHDVLAKAGSQFLEAYEARRAKGDTRITTLNKRVYWTENFVATPPAPKAEAAKEPAKDSKKTDKAGKADKVAQG